MRAELLTPTVAAAPGQPIVVRMEVVNTSAVIDEIWLDAPGLDPASIPTEQVVTPSVPLPTNELSWLGKVRDAVNASIMPLAVAAVVGFAFAVLRRVRAGARSSA